MKINPSAGFDHYKKYVGSVKNGELTPAKEDGKARAASAANTDKITLSGDAAARAENSRLVAGLSSEVEGTAGTGRLQQLQEQVQNGTYSVDSGALADAILGFDATV